MKLKGKNLRRAFLPAFTLFVLLAMGSIAFALDNSTNYKAKSGPHEDAKLILRIKQSNGNDLDYPMYQNGNEANGGLSGATYDKERNLLSLENFNHPECYIRASMMGDDFTIKVTGTCVVSYIDIVTEEYTGSKGETLYWGGCLTIDGTGTLVVNKDKSISEGITLLAYGSDARLNITKSASVKVYGSEYAMYIYGSSGFYDYKAFTVNSKSLQAVYPKYQIGAFAYEGELNLKNYWVKSKAVEIKGTGKESDVVVKDPEKPEQKLTVTSKYTKTYGDKPFYLSVKSSGDGMPVYTSSDKTVAAVDSSGKVTINGGGTAKITVYAMETDNYKQSDSKKITVKVKKAANSLKVSGKTATVKYSKVKKKAQTLKVSRVITFKIKGKGPLSYKLVSVSKSKLKKYFKIDAETGKVTVKKGLKKGTYKVKIKVRAEGNANYNATGWKSVTFKVKVK